MARVITYTPSADDPVYSRGWVVVSFQRLAPPTSDSPPDSASSPPASRSASLRQAKASGRSRGTSAPRRGKRKAPEPE